jgi:hypothetical protein
MDRMADHAKPAAPGMAKAAAWTVFLSMAATSATFQVYHSVHSGRMPWELAGLYGVVPLLISVCLLEVITHWGTAPSWAPYVAYAIMGGAMLLSAIATGSVVVRAAPPHMSGVFGVLMDGAALLAVHYLLNGPREAAEEAARAHAEEAAVARAEADERTALRAELDTLAAEVGPLRDALATAQQEAAQANAKAASLAAKLAIVSAPKSRKATAKSAQRGAAKSAQGDDTTTELRALMELRADPELCRPRMGGELARRLGVAASTGRRLHQLHTVDGRLRESLAERSAEHPDEHSGERSEERS